MAHLAARQKQATRAELERELKRRDRQKLKQLGQDIRDAKKLRAERVGNIRSRCRSQRERFETRAQEARKRLRESIRRMKENARNLCAVEITDARASTGEVIAKAVAALEHERGYQASLKAWTRPTTCAVTKGRRREQLGESDCEVSSNLDEPGLRVVWEHVKGKIKPKGRSTRTEVFLQWVHDHPADAAAIQYAEEEKAVAELVRNEARMRKDLKKADRYRRKSPEELRELLAGVPF